MGFFAPAARNQLTPSTPPDSSPRARDSYNDPLRVCAPEPAADPATTPRALDMLDARGARSTFFCIGRRVEAHRELAAEIARRGHRVENHSHRHRNAFWFLPPAMLRDEIERAQEAIAAATGHAPRLFRAPAGIRSPLLEPALARAGLDLAAWTRRGFDTVTGDAGRVLARLVRGLAPGDILLLHDGSSARADSGGAVLLEALPRLLDAVAAAGLNPVPLEPPTAGEGINEG